MYEYLLEGMMLERFITFQRQYLTQRAKPFVLQKRVLHKFGHYNKFFRILQLEQMSIVLQELHGVTGGQFSFDIIVQKILDVSYWWPTMN